MRFRLLLCTMVMALAAFAPNVGMASECGKEFVIGQERFAALNCCRCASGGSPCRCGRASGYTSCSCATQCTTGYFDEKGLIQSAMAEVIVPELVASSEGRNISFVGRVLREAMIMETQASVENSLHFVIRAPSGRLYSQLVPIGAYFSVKIPTMEFNAIAGPNLAEVSMGDFIAGDDQRAYLITLNRSH
jgi:hypothetical protein